MIEEKSVMQRRERNKELIVWFGETISTSFSHQLHNHNHILIWTLNMNQDKLGSTKLIHLSLVLVLIHSFSSLPPSSSSSIHFISSSFSYCCISNRWEYWNEGEVIECSSHFPSFSSHSSLFCSSSTSNSYFYHYHLMASNSNTWLCFGFVFWWFHFIFIPPISLIIWLISFAAWSQQFTIITRKHWWFDQSRATHCSW